MKKIFALLAALALGITMTGCSTQSSDSDQVGIVYDAGSLSSKTFQECIDQGARTFSGPGDDGYSYPAGQRTYAFTGGEGADAEPVSVSTKDNVEMTSAGVVTFTPDLSCKPTKDWPGGMRQRFHETIGNKYKAYEDEGWGRMLGVYIGQSLQRAMNEATAGRPWKALYNDPATKREWEKKVAELLPGYVKGMAGEDFFVNISVSIQKPKPPAEVLRALEAEQVAVTQNNAQRQQNTKIRTELDSIRALVKVLGPNGYILYKAIQDGKITVVPVPQGGSINVNPN